MTLDMNEIGSISVDTSQYPNATLEIKDKRNCMIKSINYKTHDKANEVMSEIFMAWNRFLKDKENET